MRVGYPVTLIETGEQAIVVNLFPQGTPEHREPWAKLMQGHGKDGVSFFCRELVELRPS